MLKRLILFLIVPVFLIPFPGFAKKPIHVIVLHFTIHSPGEYSYLETKIPGEIKKQLQQEGARVSVLNIGDRSFSKGEVSHFDQIRKFGVKKEAEFVIWGSLTRIGQTFSLDAKMIESHSKKRPSIFIVEGEGIENLLGSVRQLSRDLSIKLFKQEKIADVVVSGNKRIEAVAIKRNIKTSPGDLYIAKNLSEDLKRVYSMGYFEDVRIEAETGPGGKTITFWVKEKPTIRKVRFKGNRIFDDDELKEGLNMNTGSILNIFKIRNDIERMENLYKEKNYQNIKISYEVFSLKRNQADLEFTIIEGQKVRIKRITFKGNSVFTDKKLKKVMKTSEKGYFSWLTSSGELNQEDLTQDIAKIAAFYHNAGYIRARVGEPEIRYEDAWIYLTMKIHEGDRFKVGKVDMKGDLLLPAKQLGTHLKIRGEKFFNREVVRNDITALTDLYSDEGYAYAEISPTIDRDLKKLTVDITYEIKKGKRVYFENIVIDGNRKTRDKVIRRELHVYEQEYFSGKRLKRSVRNLYRLDFFEDIKVNTTKGSADDKINLKIEVTEKPTGTFSIGGGYSTVNQLFGTASISQRNLFGRGQIVRLNSEVGARTTKYNFSFTEPWLFDIPLSAGLDLYSWDKDYDTYEKNSLGGGIRLGYRVYDFTRAYISYVYDIGDISNIDDDAASSIKEMEGTNIKSSISSSLRYDSRNKIFNPTEGSEHRISVEYAGLGGDIGFTKYLAETGWYFPLFLKTVGFLHGEAGYVTQNGDGKLPDWERFYLGGINSLRGFDWREVHAEDENGDDIGGDKYIQLNIEYLIPLFEEAGIFGVIFYDTGNVYGDDESIDLADLRQTAGFGFRWFSPIGPIRLEYGYILDPREGESTGGRWEFAVGTAF